MRSSSTLSLLSPLLSFGLLSSVALAQAPMPSSPLAPAAPVPAAPTATAPASPPVTTVPAPSAPGAAPQPPAAAAPAPAAGAGAVPPAMGTPGAAASGTATIGVGPTAAPNAAAPNAAAPNAAAPNAAGANAASAPPPPMDFDGSASARAGVGGDGLEGGEEELSPEGLERLLSLEEQNNIWGSSGLLRTTAAGSGAEGTFRLHMLTDWFHSTGFLCYDNAPCVAASRSTQDDATHFGMRIGVSVTPVDFLEAYATIRSESNSNSAGQTKLLQILGDSAIGVKAFTPNRIGQLFNFGGSFDMLFMNGAGSVGPDMGAASFKLKLLSTLDFREPNDAGLPLRLHANLGYFFDNSATIVEQIERDRDAQNDTRGSRITRVERFGLGINRVDQVQLGIGAEGMFSVVRPFVEWNLGLAANWRQGYQCNPKTASGDNCLANDESLPAMPSTLTLGARVNPWLKGLSALLAMDIGTGGTARFIEELAPTPEWDLWLGVGYAVDATEPWGGRTRVVERLVPASNLLPRIRGFVHEKEKTEGIANAIVRYEGRADLTAMATGTDGVFVTTGLAPGAYTFGLTAEGYKPGQCTGVVASAAVAAPPAGAAPGATAPGGAPTPAPAAPARTPTSDAIVTLDCAMEALPKTGGITGRAVDGESNTPVPSASVRLIDLQTKELALAVEGGSFHVENLPPGVYTLKADTPDHMLHTEQVEVRAREDARVELHLNKRPLKGDVEIAGNEVKIKRQIHFETDSARIMPDSTALLEEISDVMVRTTCLQQVEIQGHTDNTGTSEHNKLLSEQRANAVRVWLADHGVDSSRLIAKGYGQEHPISPNLTPAGKERNRRVQFIILQKDKNCTRAGAAPAAPARAGGAPAPATKPAGGATPAPMPKLPNPAMPF